MAAIILSGVIFAGMFAVRDVASASVGSVIVVKVTDSNRDRLFSTKVRSDTSETYNPRNRTFEGVPSIARTQGGRLYAMWQTGGTNEPQLANYFVVAYSDDDGKTWVDPFLIIDHSDEDVSIMPFTMWVDDANKLWIGFSPSGISCWVITSENPDAAPSEVAFSEPVKWMDAIILTKPVFLSNGEWMLAGRSIEDDTKVNVYSSSDRGGSWMLKGSYTGAKKWAPEPMIVELSDGRLWLLARVNDAENNNGEQSYGVESCYSSDGGATWKDVRTNLDEPLRGPGSRFSFTRLKSGNLLFITNASLRYRTNVTAYLSADEGKTWSRGLSLDANWATSYPDIAEGEDGKIYCIYDKGRYGDSFYIAMATFTEENVTESVAPEINYISVKPYIDLGGGEEDDPPESKGCTGSASAQVGGLSAALCILALCLCRKNG